MFDIKTFIADNNIRQRDLANKIGYSEEYISRVINGNFPINDKLEAKIKKAYPEFFMSQPNITVQEDPAPYTKDIHVGKAVFVDPKAPREINHDPGGKYIPFYDIEVFATISPAMGDVVALKPDTFIRIPMFSQGQYAVQVTGHSMKGYINHADWVVIRRITDRTEIIYGEPYLIVTKADNLKTVKFIKQGDSPDTFWLVPYNIEQFEPQEIKKASILELYRVIGVFKSV